MTDSETQSSVSLSDEEGVRRMLTETVFGLWKSSTT